jgi:hypothetical protein
MVDTDVVVSFEIGFAHKRIDKTILGNYYAIISKFIFSNFRLVGSVRILLFHAVAKEKHWLLGTLITKLIWEIAHNEASLDLYLYEYQRIFRPLKMTLRFCFLFTPHTVPSNT